MEININTKEYTVREISVDVDTEDFLNVVIRIYHKNEDPINAKSYKYAAKLSLAEALTTVGTRITFSSANGE